MEKLHNEELNDLYSSPNIIRVFKSRRMSEEGYVAAPASITRFPLSSTTFHIMQRDVCTFPNFTSLEQRT